MALEHKLHSLCFLHIFWLISFIFRIKLLPDLFLPINQNIIIMVSCQRRGLVLTCKSDRNSIMFPGVIKELAASDYVTLQLPELFD